MCSLRLCCRVCVFFFTPSAVNVLTIFFYDTVYPGVRNLFLFFKNNRKWEKGSFFLKKTNSKRGNFFCLKAHTPGVSELVKKKLPVKQ